MGRLIKIWISALLVCMVEDLITKAKGQEMVFKQYGFSIAKHKPIIQYEDIEFIPYRLHLDFNAIHIQNESCSGYEQLVTILHERERQYINKISQIVPKDFQHHNKTRTKRMIFSLISNIVNFAMSGYSLYEVHKLKNTI